MLNSKYNPIGFSFTLAATDRTLNADWFTNMASGTSEEAAAMKLLHKGDMSTVRHCAAAHYCRFNDWNLLRS